MNITPLMWKNFKDSLLDDIELQESYDFNEKQIEDGGIRNIIIHLFEIKLMKELEREF